MKEFSLTFKVSHLASSRLVNRQWNEISENICKKGLLKKFPLEFNKKYKRRGEIEEDTNVHVLKKYLKLLESNKNSSVEQPSIKIVGDCFPHPIVQTFLKNYGNTLQAVQIHTNGFNELALFLKPMLLHQCPNLTTLKLWDSSFNGNGFLTEQEKKEYKKNNYLLHYFQTKITHLSIYLANRERLLEDVLMVSPHLIEVNKEFKFDSDFDEDLLLFLVLTERYYKLKDLSLEAPFQNLQRMECFNLESLSLGYCHDSNSKTLFDFILTQCLSLTFLKLEIDANCFYKVFNKGEFKDIYFPTLPKLKTLILSFFGICGKNENTVDGFAQCNFSQQFPALRSLNLFSLKTKFNFSPFFGINERHGPQLLVENLTLYYKRLDFHLLTKISQAVPNIKKLKIYKAGVKRKDIETLFTKLETLSIL